MLADTGEIVAGEGINAEREIASLTKLMTAYTALNICSTFNIKIREHFVSINKHAAYMNGTSAGLKVDEDILIIDLLYGLLLPSGNDAGIAIAQYFGKFLSYKYAQDANSNDKDRTSM
jgi:D-alanyl-D-alanine carboxypeptidase (penicillin-binding protein 5/6)